MSASPSRPVFLNLLQIRLPISGVISIAHRVSGVLMVVCIPPLIWLLGRSVSGPGGFEQVRTLLAAPTARLVILLVSWALLHHLLAGVRYLLIDIDIGVDKPSYRYSAWTVMLAAPLLALLLVGGMT